MWPNTYRRIRAEASLPFFRTILVCAGECAKVNMSCDFVNDERKRSLSEQALIKYFHLQYCYLRYGTRYKENIKEPVHRVNKSRISISYWCIKLYNKLPEEYRMKSNFKDHFWDNLLYHNESIK